MRLRRVEPILRRALRGSCAPALRGGAASVRPGADTSREPARRSGPPRRARAADVSAPTRLLVAVSGGADSTALLLGLHRLAGEMALDLHAAHLHHGLRGPDADADLDFVRALCDRLGVPLTSARWDTRGRMRRRGLSGQAGLRTLRREFLLQAARRAGARAILTAHTADDQLETLLMRLGRGTGPAGLAGMRPTNGPWLKPLLGATRAEIEADLVRAGETWREDRSNRDPRYTRSRVRHEAVPALVRALMPGVDPARARALLARRATGVMAEASLSARALDTLSAHVLRRICRIQRGVATLQARRLAALPAGVRAALLRRVWRRICPGSTGLTRRHLEALDRLIDTARGGAFIHLPGGWSAERDRGAVRFRNGAPARLSREIRLPLPGELSWGGGRLESRWITGAGARRRMGAAPGAGEFFAAEGLDGAPAVRHARADERFVPFGGRRAIRLGPFLRKQSVSNEVRRNPTVLADAGGILWVVGVRRSARAPVTASTRRVLWVHAERHD